MDIIDDLSINVAACLGRQKRLLKVMQSHQLDLVIVNQTEHVQWLTGPRFPWTMATATAIDASGNTTVVCPHKTPPAAAADTLIRYDAKWHSTLRNDQAAEVSKVLRESVDLSAKRIGVEFSSAGPHFTSALNPAPNVEWFDIEPEMYRLRRRKDSDEIARIRKAIRATELMYEKARDIIEPGINELDVFNELQSVAVREFGEMMTGTGNDYQCNARGGGPRDRIAAAGELYILDLGPAFRGYFADNARTIAVSEINKNQDAAWNAIMPVFQHIEETVKPGKSCRELFNEVQSMLDESPVGVFNHHLGHGIGLFPHEGPHLNPNWDDTFEVGDVFTAEPGLYDPEKLRAGMRLENDYLVTESGIELLTDFCIALK